MGFDLDAEIDQAVEMHRKKEGIVLDRDLCIARDSEGEVSDLATIWADMNILSRNFVKNGFENSGDPDMHRRYYRVMSVGVCSFEKSMKYWAEYPERTPQNPDDLVASIYFNPTTGEPEKIAPLAVFIEVVKRMIRRD